MLTCLHISDATSSLIGNFKYHDAKGYHNEYVREVAFFEFPGLISTAMMICLQKKIDTRSCIDQLEFYSPLYAVIGILEVFVQVVLVLTIPICMIIQLVNLRRGAVLISVDKRHASKTIMINSLLYFICQATFFIIIFLRTEILYDMSIKPEIAGLILGFSEFTLPLLYATVFPIVLICRKEELRRRYQQRLSGVIFCCREGSRVHSDYSDKTPRDIPG